MEMLDDCVNQGVTDACCTAFNAGKKPAMVLPKVEISVLLFSVVDELLLFYLFLYVLLFVL